MKTIVALYDDLSEARRVVEELVNNGIDRNSISLMAGDPQGTYASELGTPTSEANEAADGAAVGAVGGAVVGGLGGILLGLGALAIPGLGPVIAAGPIVAGLIGAGVGAAAGGLVGALVGWGIPEEEAVYYTEGIRRGGTLVSVEALDNMVSQVTEIMNRHNPIDLQERAETWRQSGWTGYQADTGVASPVGQGSTGATSQSYAGTSGQSYSGTTDQSYTDTSDQSGVDYETHYNTYYAHTGRPYRDYKAAYHYGYLLSLDDRYQGRSWNEIEGDARNYWENRHGEVGAWEDFKDAVRHAWNNVAETFDNDYDEAYCREHYTTAFASTGRPYSDYEPAYQYGYSAALDDRYYGRGWDEVEPELRQDWETNYKSQGAWENFKDAVRHAWDDITDAFDPDYDENYYRNHYNSYYANTGQTYDYYEPAYRYGYIAANDERYYDRDWNEVEPELRRDWETEYKGQGTWENFKDAVRHAWDSVTDAVVPDYDESSYWNHYNSYYSSSGRDYDYYEPAYRYGYSAAADDRFYGRDWAEIEPELRQNWETEHQGQGAWEDFKDAVRHAWDSVTSAFEPDYDEDYYRTHYGSYYANTGRDYDYYEPAYYYGYTVASDPTYQNRDWSEIEPEVRRNWETEHRDHGAWEDFKEAVRHAWSHVTAQPHTHR